MCSQLFLGKTCLQMGIFLQQTSLVCRGKLSPLQAQFESNQCLQMDKARFAVGTY